MTNKIWDVSILTTTEFLKAEKDWYIKQIDYENSLVKEALEELGLKVQIIAWDNKDEDWSTSKALLFRTIWDYFVRFEEFSTWLEEVKDKTQLFNSYDLISWNMDKHYLNDLEESGVAVCPTYFVEPGDNRSLKEVLDHCAWEEVVIKPAISGGGRHTYRLKSEDHSQYEAIYSGLIAQESMMIQEFQKNVVEKGEISLMLFAGKYSHAVLKIAKPGDFRVQDDFGGTVHEYRPNQEEITLAQQTFAACKEMPFYGRADMIRDNDGKLCISELEIIEPELWFRNRPEAAKELARAVFSRQSSVNYCRLLTEN